MSQSQVLVNGNVATLSRFLFPWIGVWIGDFELALDPVAARAFVFSGPATIVIGTITYVGTIDPTLSGSFADRIFVRITGGMNGWSNNVAGKHYNSPNGALLSTPIYAATASLVGEPPPLDPSPTNFGTDFVLMQGPAAQVFGDLDWYVDPVTGIANVAQWATASLDASATIISYDPLEQVLHMTCDVPLLPGTSISDDRLNGTTLVARTVEQVFDEHGSRVVVYTAVAPVERLGEAFTIAVRLAADTAHLKVYQYRFVLPSGSSQLALQAISPGAPDLNPITQYQSLSGTANNYKPGTVILIGFTGDMPPQPYLVTASPLAIPITTNVDGSTVNVGTSEASQVNVGSTSAQVALAGGTDYVALQGHVATALNALAAWVLTLSNSGGSLTGSPFTPPSVAAINTKAT